MAKSVTKQRFKQDLDSLYENALTTIKKALAGDETITKNMLLSAWKVLEINCKLSPAKDIAEDSLIESLTGKKKLSELSDEELQTKIHLQ